MKYEVTLEGSFVSELVVEAASEKDAEIKAKAQFDKIIGLQNEDYVIDLMVAGVTENA